MTLHIRFKYKIGFYQRIPSFLSLFQGAFWALISGFVIGMIRFGLEFAYIVPPCGSLDPDPRPDFVKIWVGKVHYLHFGAALFFFSMLVSVLVSLMTEPIPKEKVSTLQFV